VVAVLKGRPCLVGSGPVEGRREGPHQVTRSFRKGQGKEDGKKIKVIMGNEMVPEVPLKVELTPNGAPPVR
jgi:hypothetical protein